MNRIRLVTFVFMVLEGELNKFSFLRMNISVLDILDCQPPISGDIKKVQFSILLFFDIFWKMAFLRIWLRSSYNSVNFVARN